MLWLLFQSIVLGVEFSDWCWKRNWSVAFLSLNNLLFKIQASLLSSRHHYIFQKDRNSLHFVIIIYKEELIKMQKLIWVFQGWTKCSPWFANPCWCGPDCRGPCTKPLELLCFLIRVFFSRTTNSSYKFHLSWYFYDDAHHNSDLVIHNMGPICIVKTSANANNPLISFFIN